MWTTKNRPRYDRDKLRYRSDLTDPEWEQIKPLSPPAKRDGGKRTVNMREVVNGIIYGLSTGCQWRYIHSGRHQSFPDRGEITARQVAGGDGSRNVRCGNRVSLIQVGMTYRPPRVAGDAHGHGQQVCDRSTG
jgi:hypothetical protein